MTQLLIAERTPHLIVRKSAIHGRGLFAGHDIAQDAYIGRYEGPVTRRNGAYVLWIVDDDGTAYGINGKNELRFANHADDPNAELHNDELYALRDIRAGEEITIHYGPDWHGRA